MNSIVVWGKNDLRRLADEFNSTYAGGEDAQGGFIPPIALPSKFEFGDSFLTQDLRLSRELHLHEHWRMTLIGEVFNLLNIGNLTGRSGDLLSGGFRAAHQPSASGVWFGWPSGIPESRPASDF